MRWGQFCLILLNLWMVLNLDSRAEAARSKHTEAQLLAEVTQVQPGQTFWVGLQLKMDPEWHTYWRNPGDAGLPTNLRWQLPAGFTAGEIQWPYPEYIPLPPLASYAYEKEVLLLVQIQAPATLKPGTTLNLKAKAEWLECREVCLPGSGEVSLTLPVAKQTKISSSLSQYFTDTRAKLPITLPDWQITTAMVGEQFILTARNPKGPAVNEARFFPYPELLIDPPAPQKFEKTSDGFRLVMQRSKGGIAPERVEGVLYTPGGWRGPNSEPALLVNTAVGADGVGQNGTAEGGLTLGIAMGFAFLGGLILNLMPCVLPVVSIKVLGFVQQAGEDVSKARLHGLAFTGGVLISFWSLAGVLLLLRAGGENLGWGFQLQSPPVVVVLSSILFLFGLSLFGVFEIGTSLTTVGSQVETTGYGGSFASGVLATVVATPCTAPFMGSALGFALTQPLWAAFLVFTSLGLGMSAPYLLLSWSPALLKFVPRPGAWMETFKQVLGFPMLATVVWLAWVLGVQTGVNGLVSLLGGLLLLGIGAWVLGRWGTIVQSDRTRWVANGVAALTFLGGLSLGVVGASAATPTPTDAPTKVGLVTWEKFTPERVVALRKAGQPVFLDFTAAWCLSCQVNERVALDNAEVQTAFTTQKVTLLKADWTNRDPQITQALAQFGRSGVPLYVYYGPGSAQAQILPEVLTPGLVLDALKK